MSFVIILLGVAGFGLMILGIILMIIAELRIRKENKKYGINNP